MLKEMLLEEAKQITVDVALDDLFESVELSPEVKENFGTIYAQAVKANAVALAESHIEKIAAKADELVESKVEEASTEIETKLYEDADKFLNHLGAKWLAENKEAVTRNIKADLCESLIGSLKDVFVTHNVVVPEESVDVVAELDEALKEEKEKTSELFDAKLQLESEIRGMKREQAINESTRDLSDTQKEKVTALIEGLEYSETFDKKLTAIVEMVAKKEDKPAKIEESLNTDADKLNVIAEAVEESEKKATVDSGVSRYLNFI